ncbi:MAG: nodulation efficiency protein D (NfeD) [Bacteroidaceae bacterium]|nr:nodulation efficiency protein D (NfeD) [Bacteroidaceae bacterium]
MEIAITVILVLLATVLLTVEVALIPGFGVAGVLGILSMLASVFYAFFVVGNVAGWITIIVSGLICVSLFLWALYGKSLDRLALKKNIDSNVKGDELDKIKVGDRGITKTRLALIGDASINGEVVEVKSEMGFINENEDIVVIRITGGTIYVERAGK